MKYHFFLALLSSAFLVVSAEAQTFKKSYVSPGNDEALWLEVGSDGSFLVAGRTTGGTGGGLNALLTKFNASGEVLWSKSFGGSSPDNFWAARYTSDGGCLAAGRLNNDLYALKLDGGGNVQWKYAFGQGGVDEAFNCLEVANGYLVSGVTEQYGSNSRDGCIVKLDLNGNMVWVKVYNSSSGGSIFGEMQSGSNGEFRVSNGVAGGGSMIRLDAAGNILSNTLLNANFNESLYFLKSGGGGFLGSDASWSFSGNSILHPWLVQLNAQGGLVWSKYYPFPQGNSRANAEVCSDGGMVFAPYFPNNDLNTAYLTKTDANGNVTWCKSHTYDGNGKVRQARQLPDGGFIVAGQRSGSGSNGTDLFLLRIDAAGNVAGCPSGNYSIAAQIGTVSSAAITYPIITPAQTGTLGFSVTIMTPTTSTLCGCTTYAGTVTSGTAIICLPNPAPVPHNANQVLDANDLLRYILFSNPNDTLGSIVATSATPSFAFNSTTMQTGVTYYAAAIAGNNLNGNVDLNDPCIDISNATQVVWHPLPTVVFSVANLNVCAGKCRTIIATFTGTAPFTLTYTTPASGTVTQIFSGNTGAFQVCTPVGSPPGSLVVQATKVVDAWCTCQ
jgi:hypothetical protein